MLGFGFFSFPKCHPTLQSFALHSQVPGFLSIYRRFVVKGFLCALQRQYQIKVVWLFLLFLHFCFLFGKKKPQNQNQKKVAGNENKG